LLGVSPAHRAVTSNAGEALEFEIVSEWPANIMAVRWHIDGVEIEEARDLWRYVLQADGLFHEVRVSVEDRTGLIRDPYVREHKGGATWTVSGDDRSMSTAKASHERRISGWIRMRVDSAGHAVMGINHTEARTLRRAGMAADSGFEYALFDAGGALLYRERIADPRMVRGPLPPRGTATPGHGVATLERGYYLIEIPEGADARKVRIRAMTGMEKTGAEPMTQGPPTEQWLDL
jgi:hypothetical protein